MQLFFTKNDKILTRGLQSILEANGVGQSCLFIPLWGEFPFQPRKTVILKTDIFSTKTFRLETKPRPLKILVVRILPQKFSAGGKIGY